MGLRPISTTFTTTRENTFSYSLAGLFIRLSCMASMSTFLLSYWHSVEDPKTVSWLYLRGYRLQTCSTLRTTCMCAPRPIHLYIHVLLLVKEPPFATYWDHASLLSATIADPPPNPLPMDRMVHATGALLEWKQWWELREAIHVHMEFKSSWFEVAMWTLHGNSTETRLCN